MRMEHEASVGVGIRIRRRVWIQHPMAIGAPIGGDRVDDALETVAWSPAVTGQAGRRRCRFWSWDGGSRLTRSVVLPDRQDATLATRGDGHGRRPRGGGGGWH